MSRFDIRLKMASGSPAQITSGSKWVQIHLEIHQHFLWSKGSYQSQCDISWSDQIVFPLTPKGRLYLINFNVHMHRWRSWRPRVMGSLSWLTLPCFYLNQLYSYLKASQFYLKKTSYVYKNSLFLTSKGDVSRSSSGWYRRGMALSVKNSRISPHTPLHTAAVNYR